MEIGGSSEGLKEGLLTTNDNVLKVRGRLETKLDPRLGNHG